MVQVKIIQLLEWDEPLNGGFFFDRCWVLLLKFLESVHLPLQARLYRLSLVQVSCAGLSN